MCKFLLSDGTGEQYINRTYSSHGSEVFTVRIYSSAQTPGGALVSHLTSSFSSAA